MILLSKYERQQIINEFEFETARSGGKGGQHVNKTESKVTLIFDINKSQVLNFGQKERIKANLANRIKDGKIRLNGESTRSQYRNKSEVILRFFTLIENALKIAKARIPTKISKSKKRKRLVNKKEHQQKKELRKKIRKSDY